MITAMRRPALLLVLTLSLAAPHAEASPQRVLVVDRAGDALLAPRSTGSSSLPDAAPSTPANQAYADVLSAELVSTHQSGRFTGLTATLHLAAPPVPPQGTVVTYRVLGDVRGLEGAQVSLVYNSGPGMDATGTPTHTLFRDTLTRVMRRVYLPEAKVRGNDLVITVPAPLIPQGFEVGDVLDNIQVDIRLCQGLQGQRVPDEVPFGYGGTSGFSVTSVDDAFSTSSFVLG